MRPEVSEAMARFAADRYGNASGSHRVARDARLAVEEAREQVAEVLGADPAEVVFTSGGTESDNLAVYGTLAERARFGGLREIEHRRGIAPGQVNDVLIVDGLVQRARCDHLMKHADALCLQCVDGVERVERQQRHSLIRL